MIPKDRSSHRRGQIRNIWTFKTGCLARLLFWLSVFSSSFSALFQSHIHFVPSPVPRYICPLSHLFCSLVIVYVFLIPCLQITAYLAWLSWHQAVSLFFLSWSLFSPSICHLCFYDLISSMSVLLSLCVTSWVWWSNIGNGFSMRNCQVS